MFFPECESLIRKMLVRDPEKRYTVSQIKRHRWMHKKGHEDEARSPVSNTDSMMASPEETEVKVKTGRKCDEPINEGLIKVMGDLGIDTNVTREVRACGLVGPRIGSTSFLLLFRL